MAGTLVTLIILLRKLDRLRWHERTSIWEPTARLFRSMGLDPYVPREVIDSAGTDPLAESVSPTTSIPIRIGPVRLARWRSLTVCVLPTMCGRTASIGLADGVPD